MSQTTSTGKSFSAQAIVVGAGLVGLAAATALAKTGLEVIHLAPKAPPDRRTSALMGPSVTILKDLDLVQNPDELGTPLKKIRIIDATKRLIRAPEALFDSCELGEDAFGVNFANAKLSSQFAGQGKNLKNLKKIAASATRLERKDGVWTIELSNHATISAPLIVGADGKNSLVRRTSGIAAREHRYKQSALVCDLELEIPLNGVSVEFHYENGPFTLVPAGGLSANLVWIDNDQNLQKLKSASRATIRNAIEEKSQNLYGKIAMKSASFVFPLVSLEAETAGKDGVVLLGEAAHAFPPIGAQGLNLGLRDVADLIKSIKQTTQDTDNWAETISYDYAKRRKRDIARTTIMVNTLFKSLLSDMVPAQILRAGSIWALKTISPLRKKAFRLGMNPAS
ncbi:2-polyprenyl-6-methoxyphenol hydroxylase [hydrothermal vent metagenome]|uniref:2-polyprenyl-6-methoxyphenol hydroxylase n=1 Tax=hydrothermal vent metagenome TaxID=652676 RepID=A0A3B0UF37_9ZZZZ